MEVSDRRMTVRPARLSANSPLEKRRSRAVITECGPIGRGQIGPVLRVAQPYGPNKVGEVVTCLGWDRGQHLPDLLFLALVPQPSLGEPPPHTPPSPLSPPHPCP